MMYSGGYSRLVPLNKIQALKAGITMFSVQMATSGVANQFWMHGLNIAQSIATYIISSGISDSGASVQRIHLEIMSVLTSNTHGGITIYLEHTAMPTIMQLMPNSRCAMLTMYSTCFDLFPVS
jgi:hypothetical protein